MNKLIAVTLVALGFAAFAADEEPQFYTNLEERISLALKVGNMNNIKWTMVEPEKIAAVDSRLAAGEKVIPNNDFVHWPMTENRWRESYKATRPLNYAFWTKAREAGSNPWHSYSRTDLAGYLNCFLEDTWRLNDVNVKILKSIASAAASRSVKRQLRKEGKTFVATEGNNPVQDRLDAVTKALDAPRMQGLTDALAHCGVTVTVDYEALIPSDDEIKKLMDDIYLGDAPLNADNCGHLQIALGVESYNAFVQKYNSDAK